MMKVSKAQFYANHLEMSPDLLCNSLPSPQLQLRSWQGVCVHGTNTGSTSRDGATSRSTNEAFLAT